jgi:hypothetical protein
MREYYLPWLVVEDLGSDREIVVARFAIESMAKDFVECRKDISEAKYIIRHEKYGK